jgi:hypothetical protein
MKITRKQLRQLINEAQEERTPEQKLLLLVRNGELYQAEAIAEAMDVDLFSVVAKDWRALDTIFEDMVNEQAMTAYLDQVADNSFEGIGFFNALLYVLPAHPTLSLGMSYEQILKLINNDPQRYNYYLDTYQALGMNWSNFLGGSVDAYQLQNFVKDWIAGIMFLKLESMYNSRSGMTAPRFFSISDALDTMR